MATKQQSNRIPSAEAGDCRVWHLPQIDARGNIFPSAEKEDRERGLQRGIEEIMEDVSGDYTPRPMTAELLKEITEVAEKEGASRGYEEGLARGLEQGRKQAFEQTRQQMQQQQQHLADIADSLFKPMHGQNEDLEKTILHMVCSLTQSIVKRELTIDSSHILAVVQQALAALPVGSKNLKVYLNPDDLALVEAFAEEQQKDWQFIGDTGLLPGGCRLETRESLVDYTVERRLETLLRQFLTKQLADEDREKSCSESESEKTDTSSNPSQINPPHESVVNGNMRTSGPVV